MKRKYELTYQAVVELDVEVDDLDQCVDEEELMIGAESLLESKPLDYLELMTIENLGELFFDEED